MSSTKAIPQVPLPAKKPPRQPLLWAALSYGTGIAVAACAWRPPFWWVVAGLGFMGAAAFFVQRRVWLAFPLALGALFFSGALAIQMQHSVTQSDNGLLAFVEDEEVLVTGHVTHEGEIRSAGFGGVRQSVDIETEEVTRGTEMMRVRTEVRLAIYGKEADEEYEADGTRVPMRILRYGERLRFWAKLRAPRNFGNPGAFDYRRYLGDHGIYVAGFDQEHKVRGVERIRGQPVGMVARTDSPQHRGQSAHLVGNRRCRTDGRRRCGRKRVSDAEHPRRLSAVRDLSHPCGFGDEREHPGFRGVLGGEASADWRGRGESANRNFVYGLCVRHRRRSSSVACGTDVECLPGSAAALPGTICTQRSGCGGASRTGADPKSLLGPSFQLTFLSVWILGALAVPVLERTSQPYLRGLRHLSSADFDRTLAPRIAQMRLDLRMMAARMPRWFGERGSMAFVSASAQGVLSAYEVLCVSALMQAGMALPVAYYFHRATVMGIPANALAVPLTGVLMPAAVLAVGFSYAWLPLAKIPGWLAAAYLHGITGTVRGLGGLRIADYRVAMPETSTIIIATGALAVAMVLAWRRRALAVSGLALLAKDISAGDSARGTRGMDVLKSDLLKIGHHGSATSSSLEFIDAVQPRWAIISVGKGNRFGQPTT